ncbi:cytochrome b/b6 domain-containing protein [bacterium]|nr:cytochrome b/b6 domain-containing protein [bacterium]
MKKIITILLSLAASSLFAQTNNDCFDCHDDVTLTVTRAGKEVSLYVNKKKFAFSSHKDVQCVGCHAELAGKELPHEEFVSKAQCVPCHASAQKFYDEGLHGTAFKQGDRLAPTCITCHGSPHEILSKTNPISPVTAIKIPELCGRCHHEGSPVQIKYDIPQSNILENYSESIHGEGLLHKGLAVSANCASCHTPHRILPHTDPRSSIARTNIAKTCTKCHQAIEVVHQKVIKGELWEKEANVLPACVDCHQPHKARKVFYDQGMANSDCMICHDKKDLKAKDGRSMYVDDHKMLDSRHNKTACSQCHVGVTPINKERPCETLTQKVDCATCHAQVGDDYKISTHGKLHANNDPNAPVCAECHGTHFIQGKNNPLSPIFASNIPNLCARCHREGEKAAVRYKGEQHDIIENYQESIHGKGLIKSGLLVTAKCTDCHSAHRELPSSDPMSTVHFSNIPETCGKCHSGVEEKFNQSIHSAAVSTSDKKLPVCNDCHTAHTIRRTDETGFMLNITNTCGKCHEDITKTYFDTYHGKVSQLGYTKTAKCYDCHGSHDILPISNSKSHLSRENVVATCQKCHPEANRRFAGYLTHATHHDPNKYPYLFWVFWGMTGLLVTTFFFSGLHTLLWLPRALQMRHVHKEYVVDPNEKQFQRFTRLNRILHIFMIVSFISLALTGLTLKFSNTGWAKFLSQLFGGFESAGYIHRVAAVIMFGIFVTHITDLIKSKRKNFKSWKAMIFSPDSLMFNKKDLKDLWGSIKWFLGVGKRPEYGRWTYWEKFDYFAVFWGIAVIGSTGLLLWFPELFTNALPGWVINIATIIHSDEALLAVGFIFTVHFFNTHLRPEKFPMDLVVFTGRMPLEEFKRDKPAEYEALVASGDLEKYLVEPYPAIVIRVIRIFGWTALTIGFSIVIWIIYAMLFSYK